jgi:hypothetical protein
MADSGGSRAVVRHNGGVSRFKENDHPRCLGGEFDMQTDERDDTFRDRKG